MESFIYNVMYFEVFVIRGELKMDVLFVFVVYILLFDGRIVVLNSIIIVLRGNFFGVKFLICI